jgi:hypothetical protein
MNRGVSSVFSGKGAQFAHGFVAQGYSLGVGGQFGWQLFSFCERLFQQRDHTIEIFEEGRLAIKDRGSS